LYDKELAHKANVNNLSLINKELHKQANVVYEIEVKLELHKTKKQNDAEQFKQIKKACKSAGLDLIFILCPLNNACP
jgi:hypothetical protein